MISKRGQRLFEAARNAATGYGAVVLGIICFIIFLMLVVAIVRFTVGLSLNSSNNTAATNTPAASATMQP